LQPQIYIRMAAPLLFLTACPDVTHMVANKLGNTSLKAPSSSVSPLPAQVKETKFINDHGQNADLLITSDQSANPQIDSADLSDGKLIIEGRALNFPYRKIMIVRVEPKPNLDGIQAERNSAGQMVVRFNLNSQDPMSGTLRVIARDLSACQTRLANGSSVCFEENSNQASFESIQVFTWAMSPQESKSLPSIAAGRLSDGPPSLREVVSNLPNQGSLYAAANAALLEMQSGTHFSGGLAVRLVAFDSLFSQLKTERGQYPGYGYSGLSGGRLYGGSTSFARQHSTAYYRGFEQTPTIGAGYQYELLGNDPYHLDRFERLVNSSGNAAPRIWQVH
jgi:hypothetical protein